MAAPGKTKRKRGKSGKFAPLIWLLTGAAIAFSFVYSAGLLSKCDFKSLGGTNGFNLFSQSKVSSSKTASSFPLVFSSAGTVSSASSQSQASSDGGAQNGVAVKIFLARQTSDSVRLVEKQVVIPQGDSLLRGTLQALLSYRDDEQNLNLVPMNTSIRKVWIKNGVAYIDFSEEFDYNSYGVMGYKVQIYQVVYTATQFPTVKAVYFYMNGRPLEKIGGDGYPVHNPVYPYSSLPKFPL